MRCLSPIYVTAPSLLHSTKYKKGLRIAVPCGKCFNCLLNKRSQWAFRLSNEVENSSSNHFITLTYDDSYLPYKFKDDCIYYVLDKKFIQRWLKNLVQYCRKYFGVVLKYYLCGEYGWKHGRPHYHMHLFNFPNDIDIYDFFQTRWPYGLVYFGSSTFGSSMYTTKHNIVKRLAVEFNPNYDVEQISKPFMLCSKGIGKSFLKSVQEELANGFINHYNLPFVIFDGARIPTPRYYKQSIPNSRFNYRRLEIESLKKYAQNVTQIPLQQNPLSPFLNSFQFHRIYDSFEDFKDSVSREYYSYFTNQKYVDDYTNKKLYNLLMKNQKL